MRAKPGASTPHVALRRDEADATPLWMSRGGDLVEMPEFTLTGPTDKGSARRPARPPPPPARDDADALEDMATDEAPSVLVRLAPALPPPAPSPDSLPPLRVAKEELAAVARAPEPSPAADDAPTGVFESWDWDEADPYTTGEFPSLTPAAGAPPAEADPYLSRSSEQVRASRPAPRDAAWEREMTGPRLAVVQAAPVDEDYGGVRAAPMPVPPRPSRPDSGGPLRAFRPSPGEVPDDWLDDDRQDTAIVIDPTLRPRGPSWATVVLVNASAWMIGFAATFLVGLVTTGSAGLVAVALTL